MLCNHHQLRQHRMSKGHLIVALALLHLRLLNVVKADCGFSIRMNAIFCE